MKDLIKEILNAISTSYWGAFLMIGLGVLTIRYIIKNPIRKSFLRIHPGKHVLAIGICFIVAGLIILYSKIAGSF
jgi:hypothetical protein